jgi:hypothetical protein
MAKKSPFRKPRAPSVRRVHDAAALARAKRAPLAPARFPEELVILVTGSRDWPVDRISVIRKELLGLFEERGVRLQDVLVVQGEAEGVDTLVKQICVEEYGIACAGFPAPWKFMGRVGNLRAAGPIRNGWMLRWTKPDIVLAFHPYLPGSKGTRNCVEQARRLNIPVRVIE